MCSRRSRRCRCRARRFGVGVVGNNAAVPLCLRPARRVREIVGNGEGVVRPFDPADGWDIAQHIAVGVLDPVRPLDVVDVDPVDNRPIELGTRALAMMVSALASSCVQRTFGDEYDPRPYPAVDDVAGPAFMLLAGCRALIVLVSSPCVAEKNHTNDVEAHGSPSRARMPRIASSGSSARQLILTPSSVEGEQPGRLCR